MAIPRPSDVRERRRRRAPAAAGNAGLHPNLLHRRRARHRLPHTLRLRPARGMATKTTRRRAATRSEESNDLGERHEGTRQAAAGLLASIPTRPSTARYAVINAYDLRGLLCSARPAHRASARPDGTTQPAAIRRTGSQMMRGATARRRRSRLRPRRGADHDLRLRQGGLPIERSTRWSGPTP